MIIIYQIGDVPVYNNLFGSGSKGLKLTRPSSWDNPVVEFSGVESTVSLLPSTSSLAKVEKIKLQGSIFSSNYLSIDGCVSRLKYVAGRRNTRIIGFMVQYVKKDDDSQVLSNLLWLENNCVITDIDINEEVGSGTTESSLDISLTIDLGLYWSGLSDLSWQYCSPSSFFLDTQDNSIAPFPLQGRFTHPRSMSELIDDNHFFKWPTTYSHMAPSVWGEYYCNSLHGVGFDYEPFGTYNVYADPLCWQSVASMYAFTGLNTSGTIQVSVRKKTGHYPDDIMTEVSELDLSILNSNMALAGYSNLRPTDVIYTGLVDPLPGYIERNGVFLTGLIPSWDYDGVSVGDLGKGMSEVAVTGIGTLGSVAAIHQFRTY